MVIGDPYKFGIMIDIVDYWSDADFKNGILNYLINGKFYPEFIYTNCLSSDLYYLLSKNYTIDNSIKNDSPLFDLEKINLIEALYNEEDNNRFKISTVTMEDYGYYLYFVPKLNNVRVIGSNIILNSEEYSYSDMIDIIIPKEDFCKVIKRFKEYYFTNIG